VSRPQASSVVGLALAAVAGGLALGSISDNSFFTHLATGRIILASGVPSSDPYSFTAAGDPWVVQSWLASTAYGLIDRWAGGAGLRILTATLVFTMIALVWRLTRAAHSLLPRLAITAAVLWTSVAFWAPRPLLFGLVALALMLVLVQDGRDPRWLVPLLWVWANSHGSFPLGLLALAAFWLGRRLDGEDDGRERRALLCAGVGTVAAAVGPIGPRLLVFPITVLGRSAILRRVVEWQSPDFSTGFARVFLVEVAAGALVLVRRPSYRIAVPLVVFSAAALLGLRNIPLASIVFVPGLAIGLAGLGRVDGRERTRANLVVGAAVVAAGVIVVVSVAGRPSYDLSSYPVDAMVWLDQHGAIGTSARVVTTDTTANALELLYGTRHRVFVDDRYDMFPLPVLEDYLVLNAGQPGWDDVLARHGIDTVLWPRSTPLGALVVESPDWSVQYQDAGVIVGCRRGRRGCPG
jgi:hypothetical protein